MTAIYDMQLHEQVGETDSLIGVNILRVPGGWIYTTIDKGGITDAVFVPFNNEFLQEKRTVTRTDYTACDGHFEVLWGKYPKRNGIRQGKANAKNKWRSLWVASKSHDDLLHDISLAIGNYAIDNDYPKDMERFLKADFWKEWTYKKKSAKPAEAKPIWTDDIQFNEFIKMFPGEYSVKSLNSAYNEWLNRPMIWSAIARATSEYWKVIWETTDEKYIPGPLSFLENEKWKDKGCLAYFKEQENRKREHETRLHEQRMAEKAVEEDDSEESLEDIMNEAKWEIGRKKKHWFSSLSGASPSKCRICGLQRTDEIHMSKEQEELPL